ncbi:unnamed protein product [Brachionus calyciflorus]|uniref:EF-hand domain-containing protein n=1 Tax=Brachionus calyciflorus TaxID=104777 RepID=A0A814EMF2_9BILA|nr:unnamed protein product [Brachionus calyciflorus]
MSFLKYRNIAGMDRQIDREEYAAYYDITHPYNSPYSNYRRANEEFNLLDRDRNGRIDYHEYADGESRKYGGYGGYDSYRGQGGHGNYRGHGGYYPGAYTRGYGSYY